MLHGIAMGLVEVSYERNEYRGRVLVNGETVLIGTRVVPFHKAVSEAMTLKQLYVR